MDWSQVFYAGLGGGLGAGLGSLIGLGLNKLFVINKIYHGGVVSAFAAGLAVLGMTIGKDLYRNLKLPRLGASVEQQILASMPIYPVMKKYEPEYFDKILMHMDRAARNGKDEETLINEGRAILIELLGDKAKYAAVASLTAAMKIARQNYIDFKNNKPFLCVLMINERGMGDVGPYLSKISSDLEQDYMLQIIRLPRDHIIHVDGEMAEKSSKNVIATLSKMMRPEDVLDLPKDAPREKLERICEIGVGSMDAILALPELERANYIRSILGQ